VPSKGSAAGLQDLVSGGADIVACSYPEAASLIAAGKVKSLAAMSDEPLAAAPDLPTVESETGIDLMVGSWRGLVAPAGVADEVVTKFSAAMETAWNSDAFVEFMNERGFGLIYRDAAGFGEFMAAADSANGSVMEAAGLAK